MAEDFAPADWRSDEVVAVREAPGGAHVVGIRESADYPTGTLRTNGVGFLESDAHDEIESAVDLDALDPGTVIATVHYDLTEWAYDIEYHVPAEVDDAGAGGERLRDRLRARARRFLMGTLP